MTFVLKNNNFEELLITSNQTEKNIATGICQRTWLFNNTLLQGKLQTLETPHYTLNLWDSTSSKNIKIETPENLNECFALIFMLKGYTQNEYQMKLNKKVQTTWKKGTYNALYYYGNSVSTTLMSETPIQAIELLLKKEFILELQKKYFPNNSMLSPFGKKNFYRSFQQEENLSLSLKIKSIFHELFQLQVPRMNYQMHLDAQILDFLFHYFSTLNQSKNRTLIKEEKIQSKIYLAKTIIEENYASPLSLTKLALEVGTNLCTLKKAFKKEFNTTIFNYITEKRMEQAILLLQQTDIPIQEVAQKVGYAYHTHFSSAFKRRFGITPSAFCKS